MGGAGTPPKRVFRDYRAALARLEAQGLVYASFESRVEIAALVAEREAAGPLREPWPRDPDGAPLYPGTAKSLSPVERQRRSKPARPMRCGLI